jgi:acyl carrier protein
MEQKSIKDTVVRIIADHLGLPAATLNIYSDISRDLGGDSFDLVELMITIEERFSVNIPESEMANLRTISDIIAFLEKVIPHS